MMWRIATSAALAAALVGTLGATSASAEERQEPPLRLGDTGPAVVEAHQRLAWLGYSISREERRGGAFGDSSSAAVLSFQRKFDLDETGILNARTWRKIVQVGGTVGKLPKACRTSGAVLCIDKTSKLLRFVRKGKVIKSIDVRFGVKGKETPTGTWRVYYKKRNATSGIYGPNRPRVPMPFALAYNGDFAIHFSYSFERDGYYPGGGSYGCVNIASKADSEWVFSRSRIGTRVHIYRG